MPDSTMHDALTALPHELRVALVREREGLSGAIASHLRITKEEVRRLFTLQG